MTTASFCTLGRADISSLMNTLQSGRRVEAIKMYRRITGASFMESKSFVSHLENSMGLGSKDVDYSTQVADPVELPDYVEKAQKIIADTLDAPSGTNTAEIISIVHLLRDKSPELLKFSLGSLGEEMLNFSKSIKADHPSLADINNQTLLKGGTVYERVKEALAIGEFASKENLRLLPEIIRSWFCRNHEGISKVFSRPPSRILASVQDRNRARQRLAYKDIELGVAFDEGKTACWDNLGNSYVPFCRMGPGFGDQIDYYNKMYNRLTKMGMVSQAKAVKNDISKLEKKTGDKYYGFVRTKMVEISMMLAKSMGGQLNGRRVIIPSTSFKKSFTTDDSPQSKGYVSDIYDDYVLIERSYPIHKSGLRYYNFTPRAYPLHDFNVPRPKHVQEMLGKVDQHVDVNGGALFDHLWVVVPGVTYGERESDFLEFSDGQKTYKFVDYWQFAKAFDRFMVTTGQLFPVILGEQTSRKSCYFVGFWA